MRPTPFTQPTWPNPMGYNQPQHNNVVYAPPSTQEQQNAIESWQQAAKDVTKGLIINTNEVPIHAPPYRARQISPAVRIVVGPIAGNAAATAAAISLAAVQGALTTGGTLAIVTPTAVTDWNTVLTFNIPQGMRARITGGGVSFSNGAKDALSWRIFNGLSDNDPDQWGLTDSKDYLDTFDVPMGTRNILIQVQNRDTASGTYVEARLNGWLFPVLQQDDNLQSLLLNTGMDSNGRFTQFTPPINLPNLAGRPNGQPNCPTMPPGCGPNPNAVGGCG